MDVSLCREKKRIGLWRPIRTLDSFPRRYLHKYPTRPPSQPYLSLPPPMGVATVRPNVGLSLPPRGAEMKLAGPAYSVCVGFGRTGGRLFAANVLAEYSVFPQETCVRRIALKPANCVSNETENGCVAALSENTNERFVGWFHQAWPYIRGHRGSTFVVVISSEIVDSPELIDGILQDLSLLHGLGIKFVIVPGTQLHIDRLLTERGRKGKYVGRYRITDSDSLKAAMEAAGTAQQTIQSKLSPGPPILCLRQHGDNKRWHDVGVNVVSGNFLAAKRRGVVDGIDYGATGEVKKIDVMQIKERLEADCIVLVSNLGYSSSGEVLNCNTYEVATACALAIEADKMICIMDGLIHDENERLIRFLSFQDADMLIRKRAEQSEIAANYVKAVSEDDGVSPQTIVNGIGSLKKYNAMFHNGVGFENGEGIWTGEQGFAIGGEDRLGKSSGYLAELAAAAYVCKGGVQRVHLLDGTLRGALLLELFTRDGVGMMVASDVYEGTRVARVEDIPGIKQVIQPLEVSGALIRRAPDELIEAIDSFIVVERDGSIIACAALFPYFQERSGELACIAVSPECRGNGQGDKLLDYIERKASSLGLQRLFLLTTRAADWFVRRGFVECSIKFIPEAKRKKINLSRRSKYYMKKLQPQYSEFTVSEP